MRFTTKKRIGVIGGIYFPEPLGIEVIRYHFSKVQPKTWLRRCNSILKDIEQGQLHGIIIYIATPLFLQASKDEYYEYWKQLLTIMKKTKSLIIAYEENMHENFDFYDYDQKRYLNLKQINRRINKLKKEIKKYPPKKTVNDGNYFDVEEEIKITEEGIAKNNQENVKVDITRGVLEYKLFKLEKAKERIEDYQSRTDRVSEFIEGILSSGIELSTFKEKQIIAYRIETFLEELVKDVFFSVYVPREQVFSDEFGQFLKIFEKYLQQIEGLNFTVDSQTSVNGITYFFRSKDSAVDLAKFSNSLKRFDDFIDLCSKNPDSALEILKNKFPNPTKALEIIQDFTKKYQRLSIDIKHQQQRIQLTMKQEIEAALLEFNIQGTAALMFDMDGSIKKSINFVESNLQLTELAKNNRRYSEEDFVIIDLAKKYGEENEIVSIKSNIEKLKDMQMSFSERQTAMDKVKSFLIRTGRKAMKHAEDIGVKVLTTYLESQVKGPS